MTSVGQSKEDANEQIKDFLSGINENKHLIKGTSINNIYKKAKENLKNENYDELFGKVQINSDSKVITTKKQLLDKTVQECWYKAYAKEFITDRINFLSSALNLKYNQLFIRTQRTKWGNCTADKNISLNWKLIKCPDYVIDYVCRHELCHTKIMNHGVQFKTLLNSLCPNVDKAQKWLTDYGYCL
ncbi:MAG: M48 family metallopeptidase [Treponema sp.]|nr:M48 family metallopeptidase [Treponema sp.]MBP3562357.1 M48 family metallopeptidase [Treponema sp.]